MNKSDVVMVCAISFLIGWNICYFMMRRVYGETEKLISKLMGVIKHHES